MFEQIQLRLEGQDAERRGVDAPKHGGHSVGIRVGNCMRPANIGKGQGLFAAQQRGCGGGQAARWLTVFCSDSASLLKAARSRRPIA